GSAPGPDGAGQRTMADVTHPSIPCSGRSRAAPPRNAPARRGVRAAGLHRDRDRRAVRRGRPGHGLAGGARRRVPPLNPTPRSPLVNLARLLSERPALRLDRDVVTFARLERDSARAAAYLRSLGVQPGDRVGLYLPNVPEFAVLYYGILRAGGVVVPMNPLLKEREVEHCMADSG